LPSFRAFGLPANDLITRFREFNPWIRRHAATIKGHSAVCAFLTVREMLAEFGIALPDCPEAGAASSPAGNVTDSPREGKRWGEIKGRFE
jgi:hypothetical protein